MEEEEADQEQEGLGVVAGPLLVVVEVGCGVVYKLVCGLAAVAHPPTRLAWVAVQRHS